MVNLRSYFPELEAANNLYLNLGHFLHGDLSPEIGIVLDAAETALGRPVEGLTGDEITRALRATGNADLAIELRAVVTLYNAVRNGG